MYNSYIVTMIGYKDKQKLITFGKHLLTLNSKLSIGTHTLTPVNYLQEKEAFFQSDTYNPQFIYQPPNTCDIRNELNQLSEELSTINIPREIYFYIRNQISAISKDIYFLETIGTKHFVDASNAIFEFGDVDSKSFLQEIPQITFSEPNNCKLKSAEEMAITFRDYIDTLGLEYEVHIDHVNDHIIRVGRNKLIIGAKVKRFCNNVERLMVHEIESHILQRYNLINAQNPLLRLIPHSDSLLWGEGLAVYNEIKSGTITRSAYETYYYRVKAVEMLHKSFREIFNLLANHVSQEKAYMITYRVKRGMSDTSLPGGYAKDASYLLGYKTVKKYIESGGDVEFLYISRFPVLGELLYDNELLSHDSILLPKYLREKSEITKNSFTQPVSPTPFLRQEAS